MRDRRFFPFLCSIDRRKINVPALQRLTNNESDETERFRYSADIYENSRHVANLDASASTASISNNTRGKNDIGHAIVHRFFSPLSSLPLSLSLSLRRKFSFSKHWSTLIEYLIANTVSARSRQRDQTLAPLKCAKYSLSLSKKRDYSLYVCVPSRMQINVRMERARAIFHAPLFSQRAFPPFSSCSVHSFPSLRERRLFVRMLNYRSTATPKRSIVADSCR